MSEEFDDVVKTLDQRVKLTSAQDLKDSILEIRSKVFHALSMEKKGPSEEGLGALDKSEERVSNRAAIASSVADTKGITGAHKDKLIADEVAKERTKQEEIAKKQQDALRKKLEDAKLQVEAAIASKTEAENKSKLAAATVEQQDAQLEAEKQGTRARVKKAEEVAVKTKADLQALNEKMQNMKRKFEEGEQLDNADFDDVSNAKPAKQRKTADELKDERLQKAVADADGDEEEGRQIFNANEELREEKRQAAADRRRSKQEAETRMKFLPEMQQELKTEQAKTACLTQTLGEAQEENRQLTKTYRDTLKTKKQELRQLAEDVAELTDSLENEKHRKVVTKHVMGELVKTHGVDKKLIDELFSRFHREKLERDGLAESEA